MIDINATLLYQLVNFLILLIALNLILFRPLRRVMRERESEISGAFTEAKAAQEKTQTLLSRYQAALAEAKQKATATYNALYQQGLDGQRDLIASARARAAEQLEAAKAGIASAAESARAALRSEAQQLAQEIAGKLLGRSA